MRWMNWTRWWRERRRRVVNNVFSGEQRACSDERPFFRRKGILTGEALLIVNLVLRLVQQFACEDKDAQPSARAVTSTHPSMTAWSSSWMHIKVGAPRLAMSVKRSVGPVNFAVRQHCAVSIGLSRVACPLTLSHRTTCSFNYYTDYYTLSL